MITEQHLSYVQSVSVIIPTYNREALIEKAVRSVINQSHPSSEIIVADDGSVDRTEDVINHISDSRIKFLKNSNNRGAQAARNEGIKAATGEWVAFLDSDDEWMPHRIQDALEAATNTNAGVIYSNYIQRYTENGQEMERMMNPEVCEGNVSERILAKSFVSFPGLMVKRDLLLKIGLLDDSIVAWQEWETAIRLSLISEFAYVNEPAFYWNWHPGETISKSQIRDAVGILQILVKHKNLFVQKHMEYLILAHLKNDLNKLPSVNQIEVLALRKQIVNLIYRYEKTIETVLQT